MKKLNLIIFTLGLCFSASSVATNALNLILSESEELSFTLYENDTYAYIYDHFQPVYIEPYVFFVMVESGEHENHKLWSYNTESGELADLNLPGVNALLQFKNKAIAIFDGYNTHPFQHMLVLDGLNQNGHRIPGSFNPGLRSHLISDKFFYFHSDNLYKISQFNGSDEPITHNVLLSYFGIFDYRISTDVCENESGGFSHFSEDRHFDGRVKKFFSGTFFNNSFNSTAMVEIDDYFRTTEGSESYGPKLFSFDNKCYVSNRDDYISPFRLKFIITGPEGDAAINLLDNQFIANLSGFTVFNDKLFAVEYHQGAIMYTIHQLDGVSMESIKHVDVMLTEPLQDTAVPVLSSNANYLISGAPVVKLFDDELIEKPLNNHQQSHPIKMYHYGYHTPLGDALVVNNNHYTSRINYDYNFSVFNLEYNHWINRRYGNDAQTIPENLTKEFAIIEGDTVTYRFKANDHLYIDELYVNPSSETLTMVAFDKLTGKRSLYQLQDIPQINQQINGSWYSPDYPNQGLSIAKGTRHDGSEYVYLTAYLYRNGKPLWVAGVTDLINHPRSLNIPLYEFNGPQFLEANQSANQQLFGDITLSLSDCNELQIEINNDNTTDSLTFYRADNVNHQNWCQ